MSDIKLACDVAEQVRTICDKHGNNPGELINILHEAQHLHGYLPEEMQRIIASKLNIPVSKVYGVVTFYTFFTMTPKGKHPISVCMGTACYVRGSEKLLEEFKRVLVRSLHFSEILRYRFHKQNGGRLPLHHLLYRK